MASGRYWALVSSSSLWLDVVVAGESFEAFFSPYLSLTGFYDDDDAKACFCRCFASSLILFGPSLSVLVVGQGMQKRGHLPRVETTLQDECFCCEKGGVCGKQANKNGCEEVPFRGSKLCLVQ